MINITPSSIECVPSGVNKAHLSAIILRPHSKVQPYRAVSISLGGIAAALQIVAKIPAAVVAILYAHVAQYSVKIERGHIKRLSHLCSCQRVLSRLVDESNTGFVDSNQNIVPLHRQNE